MAEDRLGEFRLFIGGKSVDALSGRTFESGNPYTGRPWARLAEGGPEDVDAAVGAARAAFDGEWGAMTGFGRAAVMRACADALTDAAERLALLEGARLGQAAARDARPDARAAPVVPLLRRAGRQAG